MSYKIKAYNVLFDGDGPVPEDAPPRPDPMPQRDLGSWLFICIIIMAIIAISLAWGYG